MATVEIEDNSAEILKALGKATDSALEIIGEKVETYAKGLVGPLGPLGRAMRREITAQLHNSIDHKFQGGSVIIGSDLDMAAYVELGTGNKYNPSADWIETQVEKGPNSGLSHWLFYDEEQHRVRVGLPMAPTPFLRPAIENHLDEYKRIVENEMKNA